MKLQFVSYDNIDIIKSNLKSWVDNFKQDSSEWLGVSQSLCKPSN